jgi:hypothetical protein
MSRCSKKCNEIKAKIDSISGLDDDVVYDWLNRIDDFVSVYVEQIKKYADRNELNGTCFNKLYHMENDNGIIKVERND